MDTRISRRPALSLYIAAIMVLAFALAPVLAATTGTGNKTSTSTAKTVTIQVDRMSVIDAIDRMFKGTGFQYTIEPGVTGTITMSLTNLPFEDAVKVVADTTGLQYVVKSGVYVFSPIPTVVTEVVESIPAGVGGEGATDVATAVTETPTDATATTESATDQTQANLDSVYSGPIFYGSMYPTPQTEQFVDIGTTRMYMTSPFMNPLIVQGPTNINPPDTTPPPWLRSPGMQRMFEQMDAVHNRFSGYSGPFNY
jgi:hypothetical protein